MENNQQNQQAGQQQTTGEQNPTLNEKGASVADYGNVMGGSGDDSAQEGQQGSREQGTESGRSGDNNTVGNP